jgi:hypothetical protein
MPSRGLIFIPDISGFTRFINETEIGHSRLIIQELLEILINANQIHLEISEIEGDAILFYKYEPDSDLRELFEQVSKMFCAFHQHLIAYDNLKYCQCKACRAAIHLNLKVICHSGEFTQYQVKNFQKLIGKDIIVAHQLLKNDIQQHDYWLITHNVLPGQARDHLVEWMQWHSSSKQTEAGEIGYHYTTLGPLKKNLSPVSLQPLPIEGKTKMVQLSHMYDSDIIPLFHAVGDFRYRGRWQDGVISVDEMNHFLPRVGMRCRYQLENGSVMVYSCSYSNQGDKIQFSEADDAGNLTCFTLEERGEKQTELIIEYYRKKNRFLPEIFQINEKRKLKESFLRSMKNLEAVVKEIHLPPVTLEEETL